MPDNKQEKNKMYLSSIIKRFMLVEEFEEFEKKYETAKLRSKGNPNIRNIHPPLEIPEGFRDYAEKYINGEMSIDAVGKVYNKSLSWTIRRIAVFMRENGQKEKANLYV